MICDSSLVIVKTTVSIRLRYLSLQFNASEVNYDKETRSTEEEICQNKISDYIKSLGTVFHTKNYRDSGTINHLIKTGVN